jgi:uncharacterized repeat protein (TIGR01451 family)
MGSNDIWIVPSAGGPAVQLTSGPANDGAPDWSPDGSRIAYQSNAMGDNDIWVIPALGGTPQRVTSSAANDNQPDWSPDGTQIAFSRDGDLWRVTFVALVSADLALTKSVDNPTPDASDTIVYTIDLSNNGPDAATGVEVTDLLPSGVTFVSATPSVGSYDDGSGLWSVGTIASGADATLTITVAVDAGTQGQAIVNTASISGSDLPDLTAVNNSASVQIVVQGATDAGLPSLTPAVYALHPARPNPSQGQTLFSFDIPLAGRTTLLLYDVSGRLVRTLVEETLEPGRYSPQWDGRDQSGRTVAPGVYFLRIHSGAFSATTKLVRLR